ncbi:MAG: alpha/beta hydrolase [Methanoregula sp.]|jgi:acetyl esterase/lipase
MIPNQPADLLTLLKSNAPDLRKPISVVRQDFSAFIDEIQDGEEGPPAIESVEITRGLQGYWISGPEAVTDQTVLFFHGGGFNLGSTRDYLGLCARIARAAQTRVFSVDYRLAPEHVFPAPVEDSVTAYKYLLSHGYLSHRIIPAGISAGGTLVLDLLLSARDQGLPLPPAGVCMSPVVNMLFEGESVTKNIDNDWLTPARLNAIRTVYLAGHDPGDPMASPVYACLYGLPRLYIQAGTHELLLSDIASFVDKARWAGVPVQFELWEGMFHCWQAFARQVPEGERALNLVGAFIQDAIAR